MVEEIENGLDPRTIHLLVEELPAVLDKKKQILFTTHSPYLLDLLDLSHIVIVEREDGQPVFRRPEKAAARRVVKVVFSGTTLHDGPTYEERLTAREAGARTFWRFPTTPEPTFDCRI